MYFQSMERHAICRRLQLKDFVPMEFQRLTKYPLLLENIMKNTKSMPATFVASCFIRTYLFTVYTVQLSIFPSFT